MTSVGPSESGNPLIRMVKGVSLQPILFVRSLPYLTAQLSVYGINFLRRPVVWLALGAHGVLLVLPAVDLSASKTEVVVEEILEEDPTIGAVSLSDILAPPEPLAPPPPEEPEAPDKPPPPSAEPPTLTEFPENADELLQEEEVPEEEEPEEEDPEEEEQEEEQSGFRQEQKNALDSSLGRYLGAGDGGANNFDVTDKDWKIYDDLGCNFRRDVTSSMPEASAFFTTDSMADCSYLPLPGVGFRMIARDADLIRQEGLGKALIEQGMNLNDVGPYGSYSLLAVSKDGQIISYISFVPIVQGSQTLVFIWPDDPR